MLEGKLGPRAMWEHFTTIIPGSLYRCEKTGEKYRVIGKYDPGTVPPRHDGCLMNTDFEVVYLERVRRIR